MDGSKPLGHGDDSGFAFAQEMLSGDATSAINFDRVQNGIHGYIIFEYLLCEEDQGSRGITPYTSHPNRYLSKNYRKFASLWEISKALSARLYLVNYAKQGTKYSDEILLMLVKSVSKGKVVTDDYRFTRKAFSNWFRKMNKASIEMSEEPPCGEIFCRMNYYHVSLDCKYIRNHRDDIIRISMEDVKKHGYMPCNECCKTKTSEEK